MIGPFPRRALARIVLLALVIAVLLGLAGTSIPTAGSSGTGLNDQGQYVIDPDKKVLGLAPDNVPAIWLKPLMMVAMHMKLP